MEAKTKTELPVTREELQQLLGEYAFTRNLGLTVHSITDRECTLHVPFHADFERPGGIVSGQVFMTAADMAMWFAIKKKLGLADASVTAEMKTSFLSGARREDFLCTAKVLKLGRRLIYGVGECVNGKGRLLTHHTLTYIHPE
jgi:uncharacterized protein (TIGR00369 family)